MSLCMRTLLPSLTAMPADSWPRCWSAKETKEGYARSFLITVGGAGCVVLSAGRHRHGGPGQAGRTSWTKQRAGYFFGGPVAADIDADLDLLQAVLRRV